MTLTYKEKVCLLTRHAWNVERHKLNRRVAELLWTKDDLLQSCRNERGNYYLRKSYMADEGEK